MNENEGKIEEKVLFIGDNNGVPATLADSGQLPKNI